jgi:hypothetical protein
MCPKENGGQCKKALTTHNHPKYKRLFGRNLLEGEIHIDTLGFLRSLG